MRFVDKMCRIGFYIKIDIIIFFYFKKGSINMAANFIDLFSGAGGMSLGFSEAGFENLFAVEIDKSFSDTYKKNFPNHHLFVKDIQNIDAKALKKIVSGKDIDTIIGGPPCQGFSLAGRIGRTFVEDDRNFLFKEFVRVVDTLKPKTFVMENVARMASHNKGNTIKEIVDSFVKIGYSVQYKILQAADFGVPQKRQRIFIVGTRNDLNLSFEFPKTIYEIEEYMTVEEAISDLPKLESGENSNIPNHNAMNHSAQMLEKMSYITDGGNRSEIPEHLRPKSGDARKYIKYNSCLPSVTVTGDMRKIFHYSQNRAATSRELARLQSFPDDFIFEGNNISVQQQIGNAVPPRLAYFVALAVSEALSKEDVKNE